VAGRAFPWPTLTLVLALVGPAAAPAVDILRLRPPADGATPVSLVADEVYTWTEGAEQVFVLGGGVWVQQDQTEVNAPRAVVWVDVNAVKRREPVRVAVYAAEGDGKKARVRTRGRAEQEAEAVVLEFTSPAFGRLRGKVHEESMAHSGLYQRARAARGVPSPDPAVRPAAALQPDPAAPATPGIPDAQFAPTVTGPTVLPVPTAETRRFWLSPRTNRPFSVYPVPTGSKGEKAWVVTGGIKLGVRFDTGSIRSLEMEADQVVIWRQEAGAAADFNDLTADGGTAGKGLEVYLSGNVVVWMGAKADLDPSGRPQQYRIVRADRVYYDVTNHRAIANNADMEFTRRGYVNTAHVTSPEIRQLSSSEFSADDARFSASRLPSDPGLAVRFDRVEIYREPLIYRETIFGKLFRDRFTGEPVAERPEIVEATDITTEVLGVPVWYWPFVRTDVNDPTGPFRGASISQNNLFGFQVYLNWDMLKLIGITPLKNERWTLLTDYLSRRGPALGTNYSLAQEKFFGLDAPFQTQVKAYAIYDKGTDILAGNRENEFQPTQLRGRFQFRHQQEFEDWTFQGQLACLSDHNFLEQYYKFEFDSGPNQETFAWLKYQSGNAAATILAEPALGRPWVNEANWLPRVDGYLLGQSLFDRFTYHTWGNVGYADLRTWRPPVEQYPPPALFPSAYAFPPAERGLTTARADWMQQISAPFDLGPARVVPYGVLDLAYYTEDNNGGSLGRIYGGGGVRASVPLSKLYPDVGSELFNLNGLYHKNLFSLNYYVAGSSASYLNTPQLDRLNDDAVQQAYQDIIPWEPTFPQLQPNGRGYALAAGSYERFNPRLYAIRRLVDFNPDHRDDIHELQLDWRQRFQTKRGYPGLEHTVDWLTVDLSASVFPVKNRDNFGSAVGFIEGNVIWNVGDRNGLYANAWVDPFEFGTRYWEVGSFFYRDDRTSLSLAYKHVDPIQSRLVSASANYVFSPKYAMTVLSTYDFGYKSSLTNSLLFTRVGTDMAVTVGFSYNSVVKDFSLVVNIVPNLIANQQSPVPYRYGGYGGAGSLSGFSPGGAYGGGGGGFGR
jgi:lipopolysaccharide export system protein LptA